MSKRLARSCLLFLCLSGLSLRAQPEEIPTIDLSWRGLSLDANIRGTSYMNGESVERIFIPNATFSKPYTYSGPLPMRFVEGTEPAIPPETLKVLAEVNLPIETKEALFFFERSSANGRLRVFPVALDDDPLQPGQVLAINATERRIAGFHDGTRFDLRSGETTVLTPEQASNSQVIQVSVQIASMEADGWQPRVNSRYGMTPDMRVRILFRSGRDGAIQIIPLRDRSAKRSALEEDEPES